MPFPFRVVTLAEYAAAVHVLVHLDLDVSQSKMDMALLRPSTFFTHVSGCPCEVFGNNRLDVGAFAKDWPHPLPDSIEVQRCRHVCEQDVEVRCLWPLVAYTEVSIDQPVRHDFVPHLERGLPYLISELRLIESGSVQEGFEARLAFHYLHHRLGTVVWMEAGV